MITSRLNVLSRRLHRSNIMRLASANYQSAAPPSSHDSSSSNPPPASDPPSTSSLDHRRDIYPHEIPLPNPDTPAQVIPLQPPQQENNSDSQQHPFAGAKEYAENQELARAAKAGIPSNLPALPQTTRGESSTSQISATPPFNTHQFFQELEKSFPTSTAESLMRATRALLVDRIGKVRREALTMKDVENQAYLFRAALSETRTEITLRQRNESAAIRASLSALRRDVDVLDNRMKSEIANLKHEIQMDLDNRKTESRGDLKQQSIAIEDVLNKAIVALGDLRAQTEEEKVATMRKTIQTLFMFVIVIILGFEFSKIQMNAQSKVQQSSEILPDSVLDDDEELLEMEVP